MFSMLLFVGLIFLTTVRSNLGQDRWEVRGPDLGETGATEVMEDRRQCVQGINDGLKRDWRHDRGG